MERVSVIVTAFNSPGTLVLVLQALARQVRRPDEVLIADDGSAEATGAALAGAAPSLPFPLIHVWQPNQGFRLARSRNNAIFAAGGDIIACLDQDTLPHHDWLDIHVRALSGGRRVSLGRCIDLRAGTVADAALVASGAFEQAHESRDLARLRHMHRKYLFYAVLRRLGLGLDCKPKLRGNNFAVWAEDLRRINGFDEEYTGWGQEDDDLGRRLYAIGVRPEIVVGRAFISHIPHPVRRAAAWEQGPNVARFLQKNVPAQCRQGLSAHPHPDVKVRRFSMQPAAAAVPSAPAPAG